MKALRIALVGLFSAAASAAFLAFLISLYTTVPTSSWSNLLATYSTAAWSGQSDAEQTVGAQGRAFG